jgi:hypothetical protein
MPRNAASLIASMDNQIFLVRSIIAFISASSVRATVSIHEQPGQAHRQRRRNRSKARPAVASAAEPRCQIQRAAQPQPGMLKTRPVAQRARPLGRSGHSSDGTDGQAAGQSGELGSGVSLTQQPLTLAPELIPGASNQRQSLAPLAPLNHRALNFECNAAAGATVAGVSARGANQAGAAAASKAAGEATEIGR